MFVRGAFLKQTFYGEFEYMLIFYIRLVVKKIGFAAVVGWLDFNFF